jgi:tetratricopeptide (TPR) repeat protein
MGWKSKARAILRSWLGALLAVSLLLAVRASAQRTDLFNGPGANTNLTPNYESRGGAVLLVKVYAENSKDRLDRQSVVKLFNQSTQTTSWQTTTDQSVASFDVPFGHYDVEVSAVGYLTGHKELQVIGSLNAIQVEVVLQRDPSAIRLGFSNERMPPKARKETKHGVSALKSGNLKQAEKWLDAAYQLAPANSDLNFLMGYLRYQQKDLNQALNYLGAAATLNPNDVQALTLLGRLGLQREDYVSASSTLEKAISADSEYWMAHKLLADAYLKQRKYEGARDQALLAIDKGKNGANSARLTLGQAQVNLGKREEGIQTLKTFLEGEPKNPTAPQVRLLIAELEASNSKPEAPAGAVATVPLTGIDPLLASPDISFTMKPWQPPGIDESKPSVAEGVTCPYENVIAMSGARVKELVEDVTRISSIEHLLHERVDEMGNPSTRQTRDFNYVASISEDKPGFLEVEEYRAEHLGLADFPDQIASSGFAALALVFHPGMRDNFEMNCEGLGELHGQPVWLLHFRQREDRPARIHDYKVGALTYSVKLKGRAWITTDKFQIVRIESELINPMKPIQLQSEHQVVEYGPVPFHKKNIELWLPKTAEIYFDFRRHRYYRRHSFDHYMLFSVDSDEKRKEPKVVPQANPQPLPN